MLGTFHTVLRAARPSQCRTLRLSSLFYRGLSSSSDSTSSSSDSEYDNKRSASKSKSKSKSNFKDTGAPSKRTNDLDEDIDPDEVRYILERAEKIKQMQKLKMAGKDGGNKSSSPAQSNNSSNGNKSTAAASDSAPPVRAVEPPYDHDTALDDFESTKTRKLLLEIIDEAKTPEEKEKALAYLAAINKERYAVREARELLSELHHLNNKDAEDTDSDSDINRTEEEVAKKQLSLRQLYEQTFTDDLSFYENSFIPLLQQAADPGMYNEVNAKSINGGLNRYNMVAPPIPQDLRLEEISYPPDNEPPKTWIQAFKRTEGHYMMSKRMAVNHIPNVRLPQVGVEWPDDVVDYRDNVRYSPLGHCIADVGKFYEPCYKKIQEVLPEGFAHCVEHEFKFTGTTRLQIRPQAIQILDTLRSLKKGLKVTDAIILDGESGTGKSCTLQHAVNFAREAEMLTMWIPNSKKLMFESLEWYPSLVYEDMWEQPGFAVELLNNFVKAHGNILSYLPRRGDYGVKYTGNPYDKSLRKAHKEREAFVLGELASKEEKKWTSKNAVPSPGDITLEDILKELDNTAANYEYERENAEELRMQAEHMGEEYVPPPDDFDLDAAKKKATEDFKLQKEMEAIEKANAEKLQKEEELKSLKSEKEAEELEEKMTTRLAKEWTSRAKEGTLMHMIEWGLAAPAQSVQLVAHLREELAMITEVPVVIAIDGINWLYHISDYYDGPEYRITADKLVLPSTFHELTPEGVRTGPLKLQNGIVLCSTDYNKQYYNSRYKITRSDRRTHKVDPFKMTPALARLSIQMGKYNDWETEAAVMNYFDRDQLQFKPNRAVIQQIRVMGDANPRKVRLYIEHGMLQWERPYHSR